ncbi:MAG: FAD-dependent oxidoreductase [Hyphomicrobiales bacterium]|nr:MAG: FAD-dependent oxidoreductase [Hyphomicrobiales bacterium]
MDRQQKFDVAIIGGGYTGLSAALHLAQKGVRVAVLEANRMGWGASGRNGGQIHSGQRQDPEWFEARYGLQAAKDYFELGNEGVKLVHDLADQHGIECELKPGLLHASHKQSYIGEYQEHVENLNKNYNGNLQWLDAAETAKRLGTESYFGAIYDPSGGHLHPLKFALGLAKAAQKAGAVLFEHSAVTGLEKGACYTLTTTEGSVVADQVLLCCNGYLPAGLAPQSDARVMPINNFIAATRPLTSDEIPIIRDECASDSRFVINYWRMSADKRLLFGGGENYSSRFPGDIKSFVRKPLAQIYPQFKDIEIDYAWGGTLGVTVHRVPFFSQLKPGLWTASGFSGHGVTIAPLAGQILAEAVLDDTARFDAFAKLPTPAFPGGRLLRWPTLVAGMCWYALRDRI